MDSPTLNRRAAGAAQYNSIEASPRAIDTILNHPENFSRLLKQTTPGVPKVHRPERVKVHLKPEELRCFGDGSTGGAIKVFFWNMLTLLIDYKRHGGNCFVEGDALDDHTADGLLRAGHIAGIGIDDFNGSDQWNWLHHLPSGEVEELIRIVRELKENLSARPEWDFSQMGGEKDVVLYPLNLKKGVGSYAMVANAKGIWFKQMDDANLAPVRLLTLQEYQNIETLDKIKLGLTAEARIAFQPYLTLQNIGHDVDDTTPVVASDMGGSTPLMVVLGIQAGKIEIDAKGIAPLVTLLNAEAKTLAQLKNAKNDEEVKRSNQSLMGIVEPAKEAEVETETADELTPMWVKNAPGSNEQILPMPRLVKESEALERYLNYKPSATPLIFSSDIASDRIRQEMKKVGAIFIAGPNDLDTVEKDEENQADVCTNAHYDSTTNTLYVNRGLRIANDAPWLIRTAMGDDPFCMPGDNPPYKFSPEAFVTWMNQRVLPKRGDALNFAPKPGAIEFAAYKLGVRIVIATDEMVDDHTWMIALNPLSSRHAQPLLAARIGHANPKIL